MDKNKAIELLKEALPQITQLKTASWDNQEYNLWRDKVLDILEVAFGAKSTEYDRFSSAWPHAVVNGTSQQNYYDELQMRETALKSIIQKLDMVGIQQDAGAEKLSSPKVFISHGGAKGTLDKLKSFLEALGVDIIIVEDKENLDRTVNVKVDDCLHEADFVVILASRDRNLKDKSVKQPRQNVIHEAGLAQKTHPGKIIYLLEKGTVFPSNMAPKVYQTFTPNKLDGAFTAIVREMRALGFLQTWKHTPISFEITK